MSDQDTNQIVALLSSLRGTIIKIAIEIQNEIKNMANLMVKALLTGSTVAKTALGQELGIKSKKDMFPKLNEIFSPIAQPAQGGVSMAPMAKMAKGLKGVFAGLGSTILSSFSPMMLLFQILSPLINAFLEPMDMLSPLMEDWGAILSQLLIPIVMALMDILMPFTPLLVLLVQVLMPIIEFVPALVAILVPAITMIVNIIMVAVQVIGSIIAIIMGVINYITTLIAFISTVFFGFFSTLFSKISEFFGKMRDDINKLFNDAINGIKQKIKDILSFFTGFWDSVSEFFGGKASNDNYRSASRTNEVLAQDTSGDSYF